MNKILVLCLVAYCGCVVATVRCPNGFLWSDGGCRKIWRDGPMKIDPIKFMAQPRRMIKAMREMLPISDQAPEEIINSNLVKRAADRKSKVTKANTDRNIISVPTQCPSGYKPDANGNCRKVIDFN